MDWEYRIIKSNDLDSKKYSIQEVLVDSDGCMVAHSIDFIIERRMMKAKRNQAKKTLSKGGVKIK